MIDFIGDIHGHADALEALLLKLGYSKKAGVYAHPDRKVLFVGDYIDRGPQIAKTLEIVKAMVDDGKAIALMGNHEYNAICFHLKDHAGGHCRPHSIKNIVQHWDTLGQFQNKQKEYNAYIDWFLTLPLFYETDTFRAVHACWDHDHINFLRENLPHNRLTKELIRQSTMPDTRLHNAIEQTLKGKEISLPPGVEFSDKDGARRDQIRIKWWENPVEMTYKSISVEPIPQLPDAHIEADLGQFDTHYGPEEKNVFFGHYWLKGSPLLYRNNICCLDYSVAKGGALVAYRYDHEDRLNPEKFLTV